VMLNSGFRRARVLALNLATSLTTLLGAFVAFFAFSVLENATPLVIAVAAGVFIYIALSDLIPAIHHEDEHRYNLVNIFAILLGAMIIFTLGFVPIGG
jgi:zinc transporter ZupT